jgi:hypothetical protein
VKQEWRGGEENQNVMQREDEKVEGGQSLVCLGVRQLGSPRIRAGQNSEAGWRLSPD